MTTANKPEVFEDLLRSHNPIELQILAKLIYLEEMVKLIYDSLGVAKEQKPLPTEDYRWDSL